MPTIVAVAGISGSGKSTAANQIVEHYGAANCVIISSDRYYREQVGRTFDQRKETNYDEPPILDLKLLDENLAHLRLGNPVKVPKYDFNTHSRFKNADGSEVREDIHPVKIVIVDGILIFEPDYLQNKFDVPVFVDTPPEIAVLRRIKRDIDERNRDFDGAMTQCLLTVIPSQNKYVMPHKTRKDMLIVANEQTYKDKNAIQLQMDPVFAAIDKKLQAQSTKVYSLFSTPTTNDQALEAKAEAAPSLGMHAIL
jgi:uridine kinase